MRQLFTLCISSAFLVPSLALAQSQAGTGATATGSGTVVVVETGALLHQTLTTLQDQLAPQPKTRAAIVWDTKSREAFAVDAQTLLKRKATRRAECVMNIRRSNRDTLLRTTLECYRADLVDDIAMLRKDETMFKRLPGLSDLQRTETLKRLASLIDAIQTVIDAIDSDVYEDANELRTTKTKLLQQYWLPYWHGKILARTDRAMRWAALIAARMQQLLALTETPSPEAEEHLLEAALCLERLVDKKNKLLQLQDYQNADTSFGQLESALLECSKPVRAAHRLIAPPAPSTGSGSNT